MTKRVTAAAVVTLGLVAFTAPAAAEDARAPGGWFAATQAVATEALARMRGRANPGDIDLEALLSAELSGNDFDGATIIDVNALPATPLNDISGSFNNGSGIVTVVQNVGSGVIIQTVTIVSVNFD